MTKEPGILRKYQIPLFFLLAYLLSWSSVPFANGGILPYGPALAAVIIVSITQGKAGLQEFWRRLTQWRAGWWYIVGPAIIVVYLLSAYAISMQLGAEPASAPALPSLGVLIQLLLLGGQWEEPGWSGYALPELQKRLGDRRNGLLVASLILAIGRAIWHLPLFLSGALPWYDIFIFSIAFQLIISWLYNKTRGSVPAIMLFHYMSNVLAGGIMLAAFPRAAGETYYALFVAIAAIIAIVITLLSKFRLGWRMPESATVS